MGLRDAVREDADRSFLPAGLEYRKSPSLEEKKKEKKNVEKKKPGSFPYGGGGREEEAGERES